MTDGTEKNTQNERLARQIQFVLEVDGLKNIFRQSPVLGQSRKENDAEHSWHLAMMAVILAEHAEAPIDPLRVIKMLLIHDIPEIDAGDAFIYDDEAVAARHQHEQRAAERLFGLLPADMAAEMLALWQEFEAGETADARFAYALDRLQPVLLNAHSEGSSWREHGITADRVLARNRPISRASADLWALAQQVIAEAVARGHLETESKEQP
jgi:putative hydrolase of HD superfamily